jgi:hypothetical protein
MEVKEVLPSSTKKELLPSSTKKELLLNRCKLELPLSRLATLLKKRCINKRLKTLPWPSKTRPGISVCLSTPPSYSA